MKKCAITEFPVMIKAWKVLSKSHTDKRRAIYNTECPYCKEVVQLSSIHMNQNKSCGCMRYKLNGRPTHGDSTSRLYKIWLDMKRRCSPTDANKIKYPYHAGKGITLCDEWKDYLEFKRWSLSSGYEDNLSIDRRDGDRNYEASNCRWVNHNVQTQNQAIRANNSSGYTGVRVKHRKGVRGDTTHYATDISVNGKRHSLGSYDNAEDAVIARNNYILANKTSHKIQIVKG